MKHHPTHSTAWLRRLALLGLSWPAMSSATSASPPAAFNGPSLAGVPVEFWLFATVLAGVALFHHFTLRTAVLGALGIALYKTLFSPFTQGAGLSGLALHLGHEWVVLSNLLLLLLGFALLAKHFEDSQVPAVLPRWLPDDWKGCFVLLVLVFVLSAFLDNIAAAMIGGAVAHTVFRGKVHTGYLAALVAASNAGGAGSVVGDTTTTMMWIAGVSPTEVLEAYIAASVALVVCGVPASLVQQQYSPIQKNQSPDARVDWARVGIVCFILLAAIVVNVLVNTQFAQLADLFPFLGVAVWLAVLATAGLRKPDWALLPGAFKGAVFLLSLVLCASMMPVDRLPAASWSTALGLGFLSAVFDNIPLTALALQQGGYDWGFLAFAVGFGGSMIWFGSSAGVAVANMYPQARSVGQWLRHGWFVALAYVVGFAVMLALVGFHPGSTLRGH
jgi:Na+/H+ antiporter NhaD/arsenite permease-like protein